MIKQQRNGEQSGNARVRAEQVVSSRALVADEFGRASAAVRVSGFDGAAAFALRTGYDFEYDFVAGEVEASAGVGREFEVAFGALEVEAAFAVGGDSELEVRGVEVVVFAAGHDDELLSAGDADFVAALLAGIGSDFDADGGFLLSGHCAACGVRD